MNVVTHPCHRASRITRNPHEVCYILTKGGGEGYEKFSLLFDCRYFHVLLPVNKVQFMEMYYY